MENTFVTTNSQAEKPPFIKALVLVVVAVLAGVVIAADVPWQFTGDDTRTYASAAVSASALPSFTTGTRMPCVATATLATAFSSNRVLYLIIR